MYVAAQHTLDPAEAMERAVRIGVGQFVTADADGPQATLLPFTAAQEEDGTWVLGAHLSKVNPQWRAAAEDPAGSEVLIVVDGGHAHVYGTDMPPEPPGSRMPRVPTWNYLTVHLRGRMTLVDPGVATRTHLGEITERFEPLWRPHTHSTEPAISGAMAALVAVQVRVRSVEGKAKLSQSLPSADLRHTIASLRARAGQGDADAGRVAAMMEEIALPYVLERESRVEAASPRTD